MALHARSIASPVQANVPARRARVALACERCKSRKQKCDGRHPSCTKCSRLGIRCEYVIPSKPMPFGRNHYVAALERRVTELEDFLTSRGLIDNVPLFCPHNIPTSSVGHDQPSTQDSIASTSTAQSMTSPQPLPSSDVDAPGSETEQGDPMVHILRDLSLESNGGYIGATSHFTIGRLVSSIVKGKHAVLRESNATLKGGHKPDNNTRPGILFCDIPADIAGKLFEGYLKHVATRYPVLQSTWIYDLHSRRDRLHIAYERSTLHLVYAIAGRFLETTGESSPDFRSESHQAQVLSHLDEMLHYHDTRSVVTLLLLAVYSLRAEGGVGAWTYAGLAMRIAIDLGLHRQTSSMSKLGFDVELRKRLFWSCYTMDRQISIPLGRPFSIADSDIDVDLPLDVDESCRDMRILEQAARLDPNTPRVESTTLTAFLHILRLRRIESGIQQTIYRVDQTVNTTSVEVDFYLEQLQVWKNGIPLDAKSRVDEASIAFDGYDYYMVFYYKCHRLLLYPLISKPQPEIQHLKACADICGGVAQTYKRLHQTLSVGYSLMALQTVFMAGLTLIYCAWLNPEEIFSSKIVNDISACSIVLFVITERWPAARKYRDAFEMVKQTVIDPLLNGNDHASKQTAVVLPSVDLPLDEGRYQYDSIVTHMSGKGTLSSMPAVLPIAIGMEQVQYQMHTSRSLADVSRPRVRPGIDQQCDQMTTRAGSLLDLDQMNDGGTVSGDLSAWSLDNMDELDFSANIEPFDLAGCSVDMGWMADSFISDAR